jgi:phosphodiesterase/alkaline phosphatase D-like protein
MYMMRRRMVRIVMAVLALGGAIEAVPGVARAAAGEEEAAVRVFPLSVASGDPTASGAVVWTKLAPSAVTADAIS